MSSWAEVVASGPPQSKEEPVDEVIPIESPAASSIDVDSGVSVVDSDFLEKEIQTETQAQRIALEAGAAEAAAGGEEKQEQKKSPKKPASSTSPICTQFQNPIVLANAVTVATFSALLGFVGFRKHQAGQLSLGVVGLGAAFVAAFGTADYCISSYLFKKYPPKK